MEQLPLQQMKTQKWRIIAVSRGGLIMANEIKKKIPSINIDFLLSAPIMTPVNDECEIARVSELEEIIIHEELVSAFDIQYDYIYAEARRKHDEKILSQTYKFRKGEKFTLKENETVLLIDEASESATKFLVAIKTILKMSPKAIYVAAPILPIEVIDSIDPLVDQILYIDDIENFTQTSCYYEEFEEVKDDTISGILGLEI